MRLQVNLLSAVINLVVLDDLADDSTHVFLVCELFKDRCDPVQLGVTHVIIPTCARYGVLWLPQVCNWRVVHDDHVGHGAPEASEILHEGIVELCTMLTEELVLAEAIGVKLRNKRLSIFG